MSFKQSPCQNPCVPPRGVHTYSSQRTRYPACYMARYCQIKTISDKSSLDLGMMFCAHPFCGSLSRLLFLATMERDVSISNRTTELGDCVHTADHQHPSLAIPSNPTRLSQWRPLTRRTRNGSLRAYKFPPMGLAGLPPHQARSLSIIIHIRYSNNLRWSEIPAIDKLPCKTIFPLPTQLQDPDGSERTRKL